ncbi:hypothetical protein IE077_001160 [Cardiosporidium cionae]|uniref:AMP-dependent synthetase/ligase domain-containing protein n=1 Tax=Cardiosporidium cionae TaxID=476202 RepID=A0ABQ7JDV6_9APIC|nr:hypothetical protein IE077_001160 [Cardiosporidium cionae]|eukprot:KAF8822059.1 hypothetical protein IE077_001160 [Cardiosporidium cionae]
MTTTLQHLFSLFHGIVSKTKENSKDETVDDFQAEKGCIALLCPLSSSSIALYHALWKSSFACLWLPQDASCSTAEWQYWLAESAAKAVIIHPQYHDEIRSSCENLCIPYFILMEEPSLLSSSQYTSFIKNSNGCHKFLQPPITHKTECEISSPMKEISPSSHTSAIYTILRHELSFGFLAVHSHASLWLQRERLNSLFNFHISEKILHCIPPIFCQGHSDILHVALKSQSCIVLPTDWKDPSTFWEDLQRFYNSTKKHISVLSLTASQAIKLASVSPPPILFQSFPMDPEALSSSLLENLRLIIIANDQPFPSVGPGRGIIKRLQRWVTKATILQTLAFPETGTVFAASSRKHTLSTSLAGETLPGVEAEIDPDTQELRIRCTSMWKKYENRPRSTKEHYIAEKLQFSTRCTATEVNGIYYIRGSTSNEMSKFPRKVSSLQLDAHKRCSRDKMHRNIEGYVHRIRLTGCNWGNLHKYKRHWKNKF